MQISDCSISMPELVPQAPPGETLPSPMPQTSPRSLRMGWLRPSPRWRETFDLALIGSSFFLTRYKLLIRPCGMNTPHIHPRATEFLYLVSNGQLETGFIEENGAIFVINPLIQGQGTTFPSPRVRSISRPIMGVDPLLSLPHLTMRTRVSVRPLNDVNIPGLFLFLFW